MIRQREIARQQQQQQQQQQAQADHARVERRRHQEREARQQTPYTREGQEQQDKIQELQQEIVMLRAAYASVTKNMTDDDIVEKAEKENINEPASRDEPGTSAM